MADDKPIIIIKKKGGHGGHHGGAWKVAYADFVTAMMAFFMVMWLVNTAEVATKQSIASYFKRPGIFSEGSGTPLLIGGAGILEDGMAPSKPQKNAGDGSMAGSAASAQGTAAPTPKIRTSPEPKQSPQSGAAGQQQGTGTAGQQQGAGALGQQQNQAQTGAGQAKEGTEMGGKGSDPEAQREASEKSAFKVLSEEIKREVNTVPELAKVLGLVNVKLEADGLQVDIMDSDTESMFALGSAQVLPEARAALIKLGELLKDFSNQIEVFGHTDARPFSSRIGGYSNWELSSDRANAARKLLEIGGVKPDRFATVSGKADRELLNTKDPNAAENRRITLKMRFKKKRTMEFKDLNIKPLSAENVNQPVNQPVEGAVTPPIEGLGFPDALPTAKPKPKSDVPDKFTPKKILKAAKAAQQKVQLEDPDQPSGPGTPNTSSGIGDSPVIGSSDGFNDF